MTLTLLIGSVVLLAHAGGPVTPPCKLDHRWQTVDVFDANSGTPNGQTVASGMASSGRAVFAIGNDIKSWLTRRSLDRGETWQTVDTVTGGLRARGTAIAATREGVLYAAGVVEPAANQVSWVVRKSVDDGRTWKTVDQIDTSATTLFPEAEAVSIARDGTVFVSGQITRRTSPTSLRSRWVTRRSTDGGASWHTVDEFPNTEVHAVARATVTGPDGKVFVAGEADNAWTIRFSSDGGATWATVATFAGTSHAYGGALARDGTVLFVGDEQRVSSPTRWVSRRGSFDSPDRWSVVDDFSGGALFASAHAATFTRDGQAFVTGQQFIRSGEQYYLTRASSSFGPFLDFDPSDRVAQAFPALDAFQEGDGATVDPDGDVFTAGALQALENKSVWLVRRLLCR